jgi:PAS domain S-box-containing protein
MLKSYFDNMSLSARDLFTALVENSRDFIYTKDLEFRYLSINAAAASVAGKPAEEVIGRDDFFIFPPDEAQAIREVEVALFADGKSRTYQETCTLGDQAVHLSTTKSVIRDADGRIVGLLGITRDITDLRKTEACLRKTAAEERARRAEIATMMEAIPAAVFIAHDPQCRRLTGNHMAHEILRVPRGRNISKSAPRHEAPQHYDVYLEGKKLAPEELPVQRAAATGKPVKDFEMDVVFDDGSKRSIFGSALPLFDDQGAPRGAVGAFVDVSQYKQLQQQLWEANRLKDNFLGILGHELRSPLAALSNCIVTNGRTNDPKLRATAQQVMERQLAQLKRLADDLLDVNRIANGKLAIEKAPVNLRKVLSAAVEANRAQIESAGRIFTVTLPSWSLIVTGDFTRLIQVFVNLLHNAAKFTPAGGLIHLTAERIETGAIVSIKDSGIGIPQHMLAKIFNPYAQVTDSDFQTNGGLGIGLSLVRHIVELHGGAVHARSDGPGTGAEFIVQLPLIAGN